MVEPVSRVVCIVQARLGSTRLPGKILAEVRPGVTMLAEVVSRVRQMRTVDDVVVAFPRAGEDYHAAQQVAHEAGASLFFAAYEVPESDVLWRYAEAADAYDADVVVRVTADCPLLDPVLADETVRIGGDWSDVDYACNFHPGAGPRLRGFAVEAFPVDMLIWAHRHAPSVPCSEREHVTPLIRQRVFSHHGTWEWHRWEDKIMRGPGLPEPATLVTGSLSAPGPPLWDVGEDGGWPNLSVDVPEDLERVRRVLAAGKGGSWREAWEAVRCEPCVK